MNGLPLIMKLQAGLLTLLAFIAVSGTLYGSTVTVQILKNIAQAFIG